MWGVSEKLLPDDERTNALRRTLLWVIALNLSYFFVEIGIAVSIGSVSLFADSVDFLEDAAINGLIYLALGWPLARRALSGKAMALFILFPAAAALITAILKFADPVAPDPLSLIFTAGGAVVINAICAYMLMKFRHDGGSMTKAAWLAARNDVFINLAVIAMGILTLTLVPNGWPDIVLGLLIVAINIGAAREVWEAATEEHLAAKALAGDFDDD